MFKEPKSTFHQPFDNHYMVIHQDTFRNILYFTTERSYYSVRFERSINSTIVAFTLAISAVLAYFGIKPEWQTSTVAIIAFFAGISPVSSIMAIVFHRKRNKHQLELKRLIDKVQSKKAAKQNTGECDALLEQVAKLMPENPNAATIETD